MGVLGGEEAGASSDGSSQPRAMTGSGNVMNECCYGLKRSYHPTDSLAFHVLLLLPSRTIPPAAAHSNLSEYGSNARLRSFTATACLSHHLRLSTSSPKPSSPKSPARQ